MKLKPTYIFLCAASFCTLSSCSSHNDEPPSADEIIFSLPPDTRADDAASMPPFQTPFALFGDMTSRKSAEPAPNIQVFDNREIKFLDNKWFYDKPEYWFPGFEHSFVALHPYGAIPSYSYTDSRLSFPFSIADNYSATPDLLVATHRRFYDDGDALPVVLKFSHVMSLINIAPAFDDKMLPEEEYMEVSKVVFSGLKTKTNINIRPAAIISNSQTDDSVVEFANDAAPGVLSISFAQPIKIRNQAGNIGIFDSKNALIMLPQSFAQDSDAKVILTYSLSTDSMVKELTIPLANQAWESGKSYTYRLLFTRIGPLIENTAIADWNVMDLGNINAY